VVRRFALVSEAAKVQARGMHPQLLSAARAMFLTAALSTAALLAQTTTPPAKPPLSAPINHDFDFWLGEWNVTTPDGKPAGTSRIESVAGGHGLLESWTGDPAAGGGNGKSLNTYHAAKQQWQQFWVGSGGGVLELAGGLVAGRMVLSGNHVVRGQAILERIAWTPNADGTVRQFWDQSRDGGQTWQPVFDGLYRRK
jgi:hypothetical protein